MNDGSRDTGRVPVPIPIEREITSVHRENERIRAAENVAGLMATVSALKQQTLTSEQVRAMVTGARDSIQANAASKMEVEQISKRVKEIQPPAFWKVISGGAGFILIVATIIWNAGARVSDLATQNAILQLKADTLASRVSKLETDGQAVQSKLDQILIRLATTNKP